jgi:hypothetical protein
VALQKLKEIFNKKSVRAAVLGTALVGAGVGGYHYMNASSDEAGLGTIIPFSITAAKQEAILTEWDENWRNICYIPGQALEEPLPPRVEQMRTLLKKMAEEDLVGGQAARVLEEQGTAICLNDNPKSWPAAYGDTTNILTVKARLDPSWQLYYALSEARHAVQQRQGLQGSVNTTIEESTRIVFALEADATATTILAAWRLRESGDPTLWQHFERDTKYKDLANLFSRSMFRDKDEMTATRLVFDAWYGKAQRMEAAFVDVETRERNQILWPVNRPYFEKLPSNFFDRLGELGDGSNYGANKSPLLKQRFKINP